MMTASRVTISPETRAKLDTPLLNKRKKQKLREELVKDYIREHRNERYSKQYLLAAAGYEAIPGTSSYQSGLKFLQRLERDKIIYSSSDKSFKKTWFLGEEVKTRMDNARVAKGRPNGYDEESEIKVIEKAAEEITKGNETVVSVSHVVQNYTVTDLEEMAREFAWKNNSDSLREFVQFVKAQ